MITIELPPTIAASPDFALSKPELARFLRLARAAVGLDGEVHVLLADDATLRRLNRTFRGKDKATDVLSFPAGPTTVFFGEPEGPGLAGDLAISLQTAARQAARFGHSLRDEVRVLLLHGVLHLAGFDHEADSGQMAAREAELRRELGLPTSLIARVNAAAAKDKKPRKRKAEVPHSAPSDSRKRVAKKATRKGPAQKRVRR
jgi:probable rRNA maturation factor